MEKVFTFNEPAFEITKSYRDTNGQMFVEGLASTSNIDATGEIMAPEAIAKMAARLVGKPLRDEHNKGWYDKLGEIVQADVIKDSTGKPALWIKAKLFDWSSKAKDLFKLLIDGATKMGLSVAGKINPGGIVRQFVESVGKYIPTYIDVEPTEVSITDHPANLDTFAYAVTKSMKDQNIPTEEVKKEVVTVKNSTTEDNEREVNNMSKTNKKLVTEGAIAPDVINFVKDYNPKMAADMSGELKKVEKKVSEDKVVEKKDEAKVVKAEPKKEEAVVTDATSTEAKTKKADVTDTKVDEKVKKVEETDTKVADEKVKKVEETDTKVDEKVKKVEETDTKVDEKVKKGGSSDLDSILSDLASTLSSLKTGLSSAGSSTETETETDTDTDSSGVDEDGINKATAMMEEAVKNLKMCLGKAKKTADDSQTSSTIVTEKAKEKVKADDKKEMIPGSNFTTEKTQEIIADLQKKVDALITKKKEESALEKVEKALADLTVKVDAIPNGRKGVAVIVEKNLGGKEEAEEVKKTQSDFVNPFEAGRKTDMYKKMMKDPDVSFQDIQKYLNAGIIPKKYNKLDEKEELRKKQLADPNVSFQEVHKSVNAEVK